MQFSRSRLVCTALLYGAVLFSCSMVFAATTDTPSPVSLRELHGHELAEACRALDAAETFRNNFKTRYSWGPHGANSPSSSRTDDDFQEGVQAYRAVISKYPGTEIAANSAIRLAGFHKYRRDYDTAIAIVKDTAAQYAGTSVEHKLFFTLGLMYLQSKDDPEEAANWFRLIPKPSSHNSAAPDVYNEHDKYYLSAQQQIAKCELTLNRATDATRRYESLKERYPGFTPEIEYEQATATVADLASRLGDACMRRLEAAIAPASVLLELTHTANHRSAAPETNEAQRIDTPHSLHTDKVLTNARMTHGKLDSRTYLVIVVVAGGALLTVGIVHSSISNPKRKDDA